MPKKPYATIRDRLTQEIENLERRIRDRDYALEILEAVIQEKKQIIALQQQTIILFQEKYNENSQN